MKRWYSLAIMAALATPVKAQGPQRAQLPDHWMTLDSLTAALGLTGAQQPKVAPHYDALNVVLKRGADKRAAMRQRMGGGGPTSMQDMTDEQRQAMRARMDSLRAELQPLQDEVSQHLQAIRAALTADQQTKFDSLPKPAVMPPMRRG
jgi:hypothetical protein